MSCRLSDLYGGFFKANVNDTPQTQEHLPFTATLLRQQKDNITFKIKQGID